MSATRVDTKCRSRRHFALLATALVLAAFPASALADGLFVPREPSSQTVPPRGFQLNAQQAVRLAAREPKVQRLGSGAGPALVARAFVFGDRYWLVRVFRGNREQAQVEIDGPTSRVRWVWSGRQLDWPPIAHGESSANATRLHWFMLIAALLFVAPFVDPRRGLRILHLDLLAIVALGASFAFAEGGHVYASTPLMYPPLLYLLGRSLWLAFRGGRPLESLTWMSPRVLASALVAVLVLRGVYVFADGAVNDVGYASLFGADSIIHGFPVYDSSAGSGQLDAYGPLVYLAYVPFSLIFPFNGLSHSAVTGAQVAALVFDLATVGALYAIGRRLRAGTAGHVLGLALGWAFAACPWTLFVLARGTNDGLVALLLSLVLLACASPLLRGVLVGAAAATKFAPLIVGALFARTEGERGVRPVLLYGAAVFVSLALLVGLYLPDGGLREFYDSTIGFQLSRSSPFSIWGLHPGWEPLRPVVTIAATLLAASAFFVPRDRSLPALAAMGAAVVLAVQLSAIHWYWFYVPWFLPYALVAFFSRSYAGSVRNSGSSSARAVAMNSS